MEKIDRAKSAPPPPPPPRSPVRQSDLSTTHLVTIGFIGQPAGRPVREDAGKKERKKEREIKMRTNLGCTQDPRSS